MIVFYFRITTHEIKRQDATKNKHDTSRRTSTQDRRRDDNENEKNRVDRNIVDRRLTRDKEHSRYKTIVASKNQTDRNRQSYEERRKSRASLSNESIVKRPKLENKPSLEKRYDRDSPSNRVENDTPGPSTNFTRPKKHYRSDRR